LKKKWKKTSFLMVSPVFWFPRALGTIFFKEKKHASWFIPSFYRKKISVLKIEVWDEEGVKVRISFSPWTINISGKQAFGNLESRTNFALLNECWTEKTELSIRDTIGSNFFKKQIGWV
jgi:hypothetical protein